MSSLAHWESSSRSALNDSESRIEARTKSFVEKLKDPNLPEEERAYTPINGEWVVEIAE